MPALLRLTLRSINSPMKRLLLLCLVVLGGFHSLRMEADDWPTWRHDPGRTAATGQELPATLHLQWKRELPPPSPTFPGDVRLCFDKSYEPVVSGKRLFLPSMLTDSVTALDTDTGRELWRVFADGPVRFAPVAWQDKVYFVSDDGFLYCVAADDGRLLWKFSPMEPDRQTYRLLGDERLVSRWPARGGPVLADGTVYFAVGIWPFEGVAVCAVDANSGRARWVNQDGSFVKDGLLDHEARFDGGLSPQGYLAVLGSKLIVPCGRALPAFFDRATGRMEPYTSGWGGRIALAKGSWYACGVGEFLFQCGDLYRVRAGSGPTSHPPKPAEFVTVEEFARQMNVPVATVDSWIEQFKLETETREGKRWLRVRNEDEITYLAWHTWSKTQPARPGEEHALQTRVRLQIDPTNAKEIGAFREPVLTPEAFYYSVPAENSIRFVSESSDYRTQPKTFRYTEMVACDLTADVEWQTKPLGGWGTPRRLAGWSNARFRQLWSLSSPLKIHIKAGSRLYAGGEGTVAAVDIPKAGAAPKISWQTSIAGAPHRMLAADGKLFVVTVEGALYCFGPKKVSPKIYADTPTPPPAPRDRWSARVAHLLQQTGIRDGYAVVLGVGSRRLIEELLRQSDLRLIVLEPDTAKVASARREFFKQGLYGRRVHVVHGDLATLRLAPYLASLVTSEEPPSPTDRRYADLLRPCGGVAWFGSAIERRGALPGSADWVHASGDAANTFASADQRVVSPLGVLWFGGGLDRVVPWVDGDPPKLPSEAVPSPYAGAIPPPRVAGGRMFIQIGDDLFASDIYTGRHLWKKTLKGLDSFVATEDSLYAVTGKNCLRLDTATGKPLAAFRSPSDADWREVRVRGDFLVGAAGQLLVCLDRRDGAVRWKRPSQRDEFGFAVGTDRVFCVDYWRLEHRRKDDPKTEQTDIMALKLASGDLLWQTSTTAPATALPKLRSSDPPLPPQLGFSEAADVLLYTRNQATAAAYRGATGQLLWAKDWPCKEPRTYTGHHPPILLADRFITHQGFVVDLQSGEPIGRLWKSRRGCPRALACTQTVFVRDGFVTYIDLATGAQTSLRGIRSGCTASHIPAGGILTAPHYMRHCNCNYPLSFSAAFVTLPEVSSWDLANAQKSR